MPPRKKSPKKQSTTKWHEPCQARVRGVVCGGTITSTRNYTFIPAPDGAPDFRLRVRLWVCERCGKKRYQEAFRILYDPDNHQPMISEYSIKAARNIWRRY